MLKYLNDLLYIYMVVAINRMQRPMVATCDDR